MLQILSSAAVVIGALRVKNKFDDNMAIPFYFVNLECNAKIFKKQTTKIIDIGNLIQWAEKIPRPKMYSHTIFEFPTLKNIGDVLRTRLF